MHSWPFDCCDTGPVHATLTPDHLPASYLRSCRQMLLERPLLVQLQWEAALGHVELGERPPPPSLTTLRHTQITASDSSSSQPVMQSVQPFNT